MSWLAGEETGEDEVGRPGVGAAGRPRAYWVLLATLTAVYLTLTVAVVTGSPLDVVDRAVARMDFVRHLPDLHPWVATYVIAGQRAPSAAVAAAWLAWRSWRTRSLRPVVVLVSALLLLNVSVGVVKVATGRLGPQLTTHARAVFAGGDIFPSGHASNAVVVFGLLAWLATRHRRTGVLLAVAGAGTVGLATIFLDTHWVTDVVGGWLAGGVVLLVLPLLEPVHRYLAGVAIVPVRAVRRWSAARRRITDGAGIRSSTP